MAPQGPRPPVSQTPSGSAGARLRAMWMDGGIGLIAKRGRQVVLRKLHEGLVERFLASPERCATSGIQSLTNLTVNSPNKLAGSFYDPTPRLVIRWILDSIRTELTDWTLIDVGTGRGRVVMEAAQYPFRRVLGVEFADELYQAAEENVSAIPLGDIRAGRVSVIHDDATHMPLPRGPLIFFLYNPFDATVMKRFLDHVMANHADAPRPMVFLYLNPVEARAFEEQDGIVASSVPEALRIRLSLLSPYSLAIYETAEINGSPLASP